MAVVYCPDCFERGNHRFVLEQPGEHMLLVIGLNPSMADGSRPDPTMRSVLRLTSDNGYDGYAMMNLSSERATDKRNLALILDEAMHLQNLDVASKLLSRYPAADLLIAFGNGILIRPYLKDCFRDLYGILRGSQGRWMQIGRLTKKGNPRHPLYARRQWRLEPFDAESYLETF